MVYKILRFFLKNIIVVFYPKVTSKKYLNKYNLTYETSQHLNFFLKKTICYESNIQAILKKYISKGDIIFDIGANIGQFSIFFHHLISNSGNIISVEPDPVNFKYLSINKEINKFVSFKLYCMLFSNRFSLRFFIAGGVS